MTASNPHGIHVGQKLAVMASRVRAAPRGVRIVQVTRITARRFKVDDGGVYRLADLCGHGHPGKVSAAAEDVKAALTEMKRLRAEQAARDKVASQREAHPGHALAARLNWSALPDTEIMDRWLHLEPEQLQRIVTELRDAGVDV